jgi:hypothetical protein
VFQYPCNKYCLCGSSRCFKSIHRNSTIAFVRSIHLGCCTSMARIEQCNRTRSTRGQGKKKERQRHKRRVNGDNGERHLDVSSLFIEIVLLPLSGAYI